MIAGSASAQDDATSRLSPRYASTVGTISDGGLQSYPLFTPELTREHIRSPDLVRSTPQQGTDQLEWYQTTTFKRTIAPATLITLGLLGYGDGGLIDREAVREWRNTFIPDFEDHFDDHTQFLAGILTLGLNAAGVPGKHKLLRATGTYALSMGIMMVAIHTGKELMAVKRPDDTSNNAFPSGHTAASFASARFLDREYGHVSYLYSLTGYSLAAYTGVMRQLNNRHWLSDVLVGAGVGLLSTDLAYILMDDIFGDKGKVPPRQPGPPRERGNPSFLDFRLAGAKQVGDLDKTDEQFFAEGGWSAGFEGAFFFNDYFGVGGDLGVAGFPINDENFVPENDTIIAIAEDILTQPFGAEWIYAGPFFNVPLGERWAVNGKLTAGVNQGAIARIIVQVKDEFQEEIGAKEVPILEFDPTATFGAAANLAVRFMVSNRIGIRVFGEYNYSKPDYKIKEITDIAEDGTVVTGPVLGVENVDFSFVSLGATVSAMLW
jgi:membrane-associated phospholipid phosphatase